MTKDIEKTGVLNTFLTPVFNGDTCLQEPQVPKATVTTVSPVEDCCTRGERGSGQGELKQIGPIHVHKSGGNVATSVERAGLHHCKAALSYLGNIVMTRGDY